MGTLASPRSLLDCLLTSPGQPKGPIPTSTPLLPLRILAYLFVYLKLHGSMTVTMVSRGTITISTQANSS